MPIGLKLALRGGKALAKGLAKGLTPKNITRFGVGETAVGAPAASANVPEGLREVVKELDLPGTASTEQYRTRFGGETTDPSLLGDIGYRALGVASDIGSELLDPIGLGYGKSLFRDQQQQYARGGRVQTGLRQNFAGGGRALKVARRWFQPLVEAQQGLRPRPAKITDVLPKPKAPKKMGTIEAPEMRKAPPEIIGSKAKPQTKAEVGTPETRRTDLEVPAPGLREKVRQKVTGVVDKAKAKFAKTPTTPKEAEQMKKSLTRRGLTQLVRKGALPVAGYTAYRLATSAENPLAPVGEAISRGLAGAQRQVQNVADVVQGHPNVDPYTGAPLNEAGRAAPVQAPAQAPVQASTQAAPESALPPSVPEGLRRQIVQQARPDPGAMINLGNYGGNAAILASASRPGGRVDTFSGTGGVGGVSEEEAAANAARLTQGQALAKSEADQLTNAIQARLASGNPEDLDFARRLAVTPEHRALIGEAERMLDLETRATTPFGRKRLLQTEEGLRAAQAAAPAQRLALAKFAAEQGQRGFENKIKAVTTAANVAKTYAEVGDASTKRLFTNIDQLIPPKINGNDNPKNTAFKLALFRSLERQGVSADQIRPELLAKYKTDFDRLASMQPDIIDQIIGTAVSPEAFQDVRPRGLREGALERQVSTPVGDVGESTYAAVPGSGIKIPFGPTIFARKSAGALQQLNELFGG